MTTAEVSLPDSWQTRKFQWLGVLPFLFFLARVVEYVWIARTPEQILWCCHLSNLLLAIGMVFWRPQLIRVAALWLLMGVPPWILDMAVSRLITPVSIISHLGGSLVALYAMSQIRAQKGSWIHALAYFLALQQVTRLLTVPGPYTNVNVAHFAYGPWKDVVSQYWLYILINSVLAAAALWLIELFLRLVFPAQSEPRKARKD